MVGWGAPRRRGDGGGSEQVPPGLAAVGATGPVDVPHPVRLELSPHARLGRRMSALAAIFVLLVFHTAMILVAVVNWNKPPATAPALERGPCDTRLGATLVIYGGIGLCFVYLLFREWLYFARHAALPTLSNLVLLVLFYVCLCTAGGFLLYYTVTLRLSCSAEAPLLYQWAKAACLFFALITVLGLAVPIVRGLARVILAPLALCMIA
jgi:hypothetical protein